MAKVLDFLVDNYIYVAAISGFFVIVLIGFLVKDKKKRENKEKGNADIKKEDMGLELSSTVVENVEQVNNEKKEEKEKKIEISNIEEVNEPIKMRNEGFLNEINSSQPIVEVNPVVEPTINLKDEAKPVLEANGQLFAIDRVEPSYDKFQVKFENSKNEEEEIKNKKIEHFDFDDTIVLDKQKLDEEVDIINFSDINKFESNDHFPDPIKSKE